MPFEEHLRLVFGKLNKTIGLLCKLQCLIPRSALLTINKTFARSHLDYGDIMNKQAYNSSFYQKIESAQYSICLAIRGAIRGISKEKLFSELGPESLQLCRWFRKLYYFYKFYKNGSPQYVFKLVSFRHSSSTNKNAENNPLFKTKHIFFKNLSFQKSCYWVVQATLERSDALVFLKNSILKFIGLIPNCVFNCENNRG